MEGVPVRPMPSTSPTTLMDSEDDKHMLPCRFFAQGYCHKGARCRFYHPNPLGLRSTIRVPPLPEVFLGRTMERGLPAVVAPPGRRERSARFPYTAQPNRSLIIRRPGLGRARRAVSMTMANQYQRQSPNNFRQTRIPNGFGGGYGESKYCYDEYGQLDGSEYPQYDDPKYNRGTVYYPVPPLKQYTLFDHIDWSEFLAEGQFPPIPIEVPVPRDREEVEMISEFRRALEELDLEHADRRNGEGNIQVESGQGDCSKKLSAKEEFHLKIHEIAMELAKEPKLPMKSLDSFFKNYTFSSKEKEALLIAPEDIARIARENKIVRYRDGNPPVSAAEDNLCKDSPRNKAVEEAADSLVRTFAEEQKDKKREKSRWLVGCCTQQQRGENNDEKENR